MGGENTVTITDDNFDEEVINHKGVCLIDFWAEWCGPCRMVAPTVNEIANEYKGKVKVGKLDTDSNPKIATKFSIMSIPSLMFFKDGQVVDKIVGVMPKGQIADRLDKALSS